MPLFYTHNINEEARLAVWKITEDEAFFRNYVTPQNEVTHPHKRLQHLAGRYLLKVLDNEFPVNKIRLDGRRPYLQDNTFHFSISHCGDFAAAILSRHFPVGIDVELKTGKLVRLVHKYLSGSEQDIISNGCFDNLTEGLTAAWSAKESMFKWYALGNVDFKKDMEIQKVECKDGFKIIKGKFHKEVNEELAIHVKFFEALCLTWVVR